LVVVPAFSLGAVHSGVGIPYYGPSVLTVVGVNGNANAGSDIDFVTIKCKRLSKSLQDFFSDRTRIFHPGNYGH